MVDELLLLLAHIMAAGNNKAGRAATKRTKLALPFERKKELRRMSIKINTAKYRAKGGKELKNVVKAKANEWYVMNTVIVSIVEVLCLPGFYFFVTCLYRYRRLQPKVNSLLKGGILAWRSETSRRITNNKVLLSMVQLMEEEVPRSKLYTIDFTEKKQDDIRGGQNPKCAFFNHI